MSITSKCSSVLVIGAGPIIIGQACEFDYSGTQACRALKKLGFRVILINSNPATIMTDEGTADSIYIEPINTKTIEQIIIAERPDCILPTVGGQTALNVAMKLDAQGILKKHGVVLIGAKRESIIRAEKRSIFNKIVADVGLRAPKNITVHSVDEIQEAFDFIGIPAIIRPSFTLGGLGGGIASSRDDFFRMADNGLQYSPVTEVQIDESIIGWKEFELEVVRDKNDNCIVVCPIENVDPMGVHTGDSITVTPIFTLRDEEYQRMRDAAFKIMRAVGVDTGGSNVQFAVNPENGDMRIIEMNPRVSRSSALASKATGYPIAKVAAQLAVGLTLDKIKNDAVPSIPASFEPTIDYVVVKIPRFNFEKFPSSDGCLSSSMKSVGEVMAIGRCFDDALQKALCSLEYGFNGLTTLFPLSISESEIKEKLVQLIPNKLLLVADAFRRCMDIDEIRMLTGYDHGFLLRIKDLVSLEDKIKIEELNRINLFRYKKRGFSDSRIAELSCRSESEIRSVRRDLEIFPVYKKVDTCAAEFSASINYFYSVYDGDGISSTECESSPSGKEKVIVLGSGPNRIGQGIEFDYACVHAILGIKELGLEGIMLNCNPETVSTDYDISDKLYFAPLTLESTLDIIEVEQSKGRLLGVVLQFGGQTPLKLAKDLNENGVNILGTPFEFIDAAEDREKFNTLIQGLGFKNPKNIICWNAVDVRENIKKVGFPLIIRPSYVLGGRAMEIVYDYVRLESYLEENSGIFERGALLLDEFLFDAIEIDVDAICDGQDVYIAGIMEHIEEAGIHSGDSAFVLPPQQIELRVINDIKRQTRDISLRLNVIGLINIQFAVKGDDLFVLEVNPRASRTTPFVAKATKLPIVKIATKVILGTKLKDFNLKNYEDYLNHVFVKQPVFVFEKFPGADILLGPEMKSTGEVMGVADDFDIAFAKAYIASGNSLPTKGSVFLSVKNKDKKKLVKIARILLDIGFKLFSTSGTEKYLASHGIFSTGVNKVKEGAPNIVDMILCRDIDLVINTSSHDVRSIRDSLSIRSSATVTGVPCSTNINSAFALVNAIKKVKDEVIEVYKI